ncbi:oligosaccharide flippase family protein [uncultured Dokdonia sp.]|uniref:oligosaccharide flippase family protein n=1 Tax=uncultured Dokdonia sp. TaxID=575653 RepID=UPI002623BDD9|nr:oligosaccharide flippase family protein [uncultured Dokdonia sp.]
MKKIYNIFLNVWNKGFFHVLIANFLFALVAFGSQLLVAKFLTEEELGFIKIFQSYIQILGILAGFGFSTSTLILCANPKNDFRKEDIFRTSLYAVLIGSFFLWFLFLILNYFNLTTNINALKELFFVFSFVIILNAVIAVFTAYFQAARVFKKYAQLLLISKITSLGFIVLFTYWYGIDGFMHGLWVGLFFSLLLNIIYIKRIFKIKLKAKIEEFNLKIREQFQIGLHGLGANIFGNLTIHMDIIILSFLMAENPKLIGQYSFATIFITGLSMVQGTIVQVSTPYFSKHLESKEVLRSIYSKYNILLFGLSILILLLMYITLPILINYFYSSKFDSSLWFLKLLLIAWFFRSLNSINISLLLSLGKTKTLNIINLISAILVGITSYISIRFFSIDIMLYSMISISILITLLTYFHIRFKKLIL